MRRIYLVFATTLGSIIAFSTPSGGQTEPNAALSASRRTAVVRAVEQIQPAVVSIHVSYRELVRRYYRDPLADLFLMPFYRRRLDQVDRTSSGSGFLINADGRILTNDHVVSDRSNRYKIEVSLPDGRTFKARHLASHPSYDLAVLQIEGANLPVASLDKSNDILVGEWAIAIGNPFDLGPTVSIGVVSAINRDFPEPQGDYYYRDMIQTDAAINPGNSGGPLVNALGEVIGINSFIYTGGQSNIGSIGIGFAVPIATAKGFLEEIAAHGKVRRPWFGFQVQKLSPQIAAYLELSSSKGILVAQVTSSSPAARAGFKELDLIVAIDGEEVADPDELIGILRGFRVGDNCLITVVRNGQEQQLEYRFEERATPQRWN